MVSIQFLDGRKFLSRPVTVGLEKKLARYGRDAMAAAVEAEEIKDGDPDTMQGELLQKYNTIMDRLEGLVTARDQIILLAFAGQFREDEYEEQVTKEEAIRVIQELQGVGGRILGKNA
jgi:hypothetical protein